MSPHKNIARHFQNNNTERKVIHALKPFATNEMREGGGCRWQWKKQTITMKTAMNKEINERTANDVNTLLISFCRDGMCTQEHVFASIYNIQRFRFICHRTSLLFIRIRFFVHRVYGFCSGFLPSKSFLMPLSKWIHHANVEQLMSLLESFAANRE